MGPKMQRTLQAPRRQRGVATVVVTLVLLLAVALISLYTSRSAVIEQRISANEVRAKQALAAANAGIDQALAYMATGGIYQKDNLTTTAVLEVDALVPIALPSAGGSTSTYQVVFRNAGDPGDHLLECAATGGAPPCLPACPASAANALEAQTTTATPWRRIVAVSCGWSDDSTSVQRVAQELAPTPSLAGTVSTPMVTKGGVDVTGNVSVFNYFNDLTVWSGEPVSSGSAPGKTYIKTAGATPAPAGNPPVPPHRQIGSGNNVPTHYQASTVKDGNTQVIGHDVVGGDSNLRDLSTEEFFEYFMNKTMDDYKKTANVVIAAANIGTVANMQSKVIWVDGNIDTVPNLGSPTNPVILVVNGNAKITGTPTVYGLIFVIGDVDAAGGGNFFGSLINTGKFSGAGGPAIVYDPQVLSTVGQMGRPAKVVGTWRDW